MSEAEDAAVAQPARVGRPRDVAADARILEATLTVFAQRGWHGLSMQEISRTAAVSKGLLYSRWNSLEALLTASFDAIRRPFPDSGHTLREALLAECHYEAAIFVGPYGPARLRLWIEGVVGPEFVRTLLRADQRLALQRLRPRVAAAKQAGEIPAEASTTRLLDIIEGAMFAHTFMATPEQQKEMREGIDQYIEDLVDDALWAARRPRPALDSL